MNCKNLVYLDLFSGTGGFAKGLQQAGFTFSKHYFSEIDKFAIANYQYNFKTSIYAGNINEIQGKKIEKPDLITFGFPCQDISIATHGKGLKGRRSSLFFEAVRIIREYRPALFIFENVKGLFSSNQGKDFEIVLKEIANIGIYDCQWQLLNTSWFLPQNRERIYFIGHLRGKPSPKVFPFSKWDKQKDEITGATGPAANKGNLLLVGGIYKKKCLNTDGLAQGYRIYSSKGISTSIIAAGHKTNYYTTTNGIRRLTPTECERLQGFSDGWTLKGFLNGKEIEISDTQRYKLLGNAVSVPVVEAIGQRLLTKEKKECTLNLLNEQALLLTTKLLILTA